MVARLDEACYCSNFVIFLACLFQYRAAYFKVDFHKKSCVLRLPYLYVSLAALVSRCCWLQLYSDSTVICEGGNSQWLQKCLPTMPKLCKTILFPKEIVWLVHSQCLRIRARVQCCLILQNYFYVLQLDWSYDLICLLLCTKSLCIFLHFYVIFSCSHNSREHIYLLCCLIDSVIRAYTKVASTTPI